MKTLRVIVTRSHRVSVDRIAEVGEVLDLPEHIAIERITTNACRLVTPAAGETGTEGAGDLAGEASASPGPAAKSAETPVAAPELPIAPAEPPTASSTAEETDNLTHSPKAPASEPAARGRKNPK